jgi:proteasome lid subunit RPN8/RPN11
MKQVIVGSEITKRLLIPSEIYEEMIAHCKEGLPYEACGILAGTDAEVKRIYRMKNIENSPVSYMMDPSEQFRVMKDMRSKGDSMLAIFHSHPCAAAYPSAKDVSLAFYDDVVYIIVSLADTVPVIKGYTITDGKVEEIEIITE